MKNRPTTKNDSRLRRHKRIRARIIGSSTRPRLAVFKSNRFISVQLIDDSKAHTIASAHGRAFGGSLGKQAAQVGKAIAEAAKTAGVTAAVFDRGGYQYAAQIKALADAARDGGLTF